MFFKTIKRSKKSSIRIGKIFTKHGTVTTPTFMPVGTKGTVKSISPDELKKIGCQIILANTYHLYLRPGVAVIKKAGGLHKFIRWSDPILTDSGGFQVFSLTKNSKSQKKNLVKIQDNGVIFHSHLDGTKHFFTPEKVISIQKNLGSDIIMPLDICLPANKSITQHQRAVELTLKWAKKSKQALAKIKNPPALFGIIQGGINPALRKYCAQELIKIGFDGYAIGGLSVGESKKDLWKIVKLLDKILPQNKPRYLMGVGEPEDLIAAGKLAMDMFDCVLPTRLARHGVAWTSQNWQKFQKLDFRKSKFKNDFSPIMKNCHCDTCKNGFSKSYLSHLIREKEILGLKLLSIHNLWLIQNLMNKIRQSV